MKTIAHVVGARPNFMKIAPVFEALRRRPGLRQLLVNTGQHYDEAMAGIFLREFGLPQPERDLDVGSGSHAVQTAKVMIGFEQVCLETRPDLVVVVGDVNSTMAATIVATKLGIPAAHVEAGLRSNDRTMPEEINRIVTDRLAELLLTPSADADANLLAEGVAPDRIHRVGRGELDGSVWRGSLLLVGRGDPTLSSKGLAALARQVKAAGIRSVTGAVLGDESYFDSLRTAPGWKSWFYINESPPLSALTVDRAFYGGRTWRNPALGAAVAFRAALRRAGISVAGAAGTGLARDGGVPLASVESAPLATILRWMDRASDNFTAELLLKQLGTLVAGQGTTAAGATFVSQTLAGAGVPLAGVRIVDGSGLSQLDRVTARELAGILEAAWADDELRPVLLAALPVAGVNGTLSDRMRRPPARGNVVAKTGTTATSSALSGYVRRRYVFSVLQNGHPVSALWARRAQDRFATVLAAQ